MKNVNYFFLLYSINILMVGVIFGNTGNELVNLLQINKYFLILITITSLELIRIASYMINYSTSHPRDIKSNNVTIKSYILAIFLVFFMIIAIVSMAYSLNHFYKLN